MISRCWEATSAKRITIDPYCERQRFNPMNVLLISYFLRRFAAEFFAEALHTRIAVALTLALARLSCYTIRYDTIEEFNVDSKAEYTA